MLVMSALPVTIRYMERDDLPQVLTIETGAHLWPWQEEDFLRTLRQRDHVGQVAVANGRILGFMVYQLVRKQNAMHLLNLSVHPEFKRLTIGSQLIAYLKAKVSPNQKRTMKRIMATVWERNVPA